MFSLSFFLAQYTHTTTSDRDTVVGACEGLTLYAPSDFLLETLTKGKMYSNKN